MRSLTIHEIENPIPAMRSPFIVIETNRGDVVKVDKNLKVTVEAKMVFTGSMTECEAYIESEIQQ